VYEAKTKPTKQTVASYLNAIEDDSRRKDCKTLSALMKKVTGIAPKMWGTSIVGFGSFHYKYASGHEGDTCMVGFSNRKSDITIYLWAGNDNPQVKAMLAELGPHKTGKACLYLKRLDGIKLPVLEKLMKHSIAESRRRFGPQ
jgi:hypothetical protein